MKNYLEKRTFLKICLLFSCTLNHLVNAQSPEINKTWGSENAQWQSFVGETIEHPLWQTRDAYDSGHILMIPLHYAFTTNDNKAISKFGSFFHRFSSQELPKGQLNQVHIIYLASRFLALKKQHGFGLTNPNDLYLFRRLLNYIHIKWNYDVAFQKGKKPFFGLKTRLDYALKKDNEGLPGHYTIITDYELFIMAIASDLFYYSKHLQLSDDKLKTLKEIKDDYLLKILKRRGAFNENGGWLFQQGLWANYKDFIYAGNKEVEDNLEPIIVNDIAEDSSHSHRWPLWLQSFYLASSTENKTFIKKIYAGLSYQFSNVVIAKEKTLPLLNNFMNGQNGVYRYRYNTIGSNTTLGYGPYALSGILGQGWYCFLNDNDTFYEEYKNSYPLSKELLNIYVGPNTTRNRFPRYVWPEFFEDGFAELIANQAYEIIKSKRFILE